MKTIQIKNFEKFLLTKRLSEKTIHEYLYYFNKFNKYELSKKNVNSFLGEKSNINPIARSFMKNLLEFVEDNYKELGYSEEDYNSIIRIKIPKITGRPEKKVIEILTIEQIYQLEKVMPNEKMKLMLLISFFGGLRVSEMIKLKVDSFDWETFSKDSEKALKFKVKGKGNKEGIVFIPSFLGKRLHTYINKNFRNISDIIFFDGDINIKWIKNKTAIWNRELKRAGKRAGIEINLHSHLFRHSFSNHLLNVKKFDIMKVKEALRHSSITSTQIYTQINKEELKKSIEEAF